MVLFLAERYFDIRRGDVAFSPRKLKERSSMKDLAGVFTPIAARADAVTPFRKTQTLAKILTRVSGASLFGIETKWPHFHFHHSRINPNLLFSPLLTSHLKQNQNTINVRDGYIFNYRKQVRLVRKI